MATPKLADHPGKPCKSQNTEKRMLVDVATFGATSAVSSNSGDAGVTLAASGTGVFALTFPAAADADGFIGLTLVSPADTVTKVWLTAIDMKAGTATVNVANTLGTQIDPASGDKLLISVVGQPYSV